MNGPPENGPIDAALLGRLLEDHGPALALYASQWTEAADDCVQEALVELARQPTVPENLRAWLYRVVKRRALNAARGARRRRERESRAAQRRLASAHTAAADRLYAMAVTEALAQLEPDDRELIVMRIWGRLTYDEIATALSISTSSAHRQYERALERLRKILEKPCSTSTHPTNSGSRPS